MLLPRTAAGSICADYAFATSQGLVVHLRATRADREPGGEHDRLRGATGGQNLDQDLGRRTWRRVDRVVGGDTNVRSGGFARPREPRIDDIGVPVPVDSRHGWPRIAESEQVDWLSAVP